MNCLITSDTHLGHCKLVTSGERPLNFERLILDNHKNAISEKDVLIHLGDVCLHKELHWHNIFLSKIKCKRWLIKGNHDKRSNTWYLDKGWDFVADSIVLKMFGKTILFTHKPEIKLYSDSFDINIHGHLHNDNHRDFDFPFLSNYHINVAMEDNNYAPFNLFKLVQKSNDKADVSLAER